MRMYDIIDKKRNGLELTESELAFLVSGYVDGCIPDYQVSAFLMAVCFSGMTDRETALLTDLMASSGDMLDLSSFGDLSVDKHSTGGVGDKTTLIIAPVVAELGCTVAKLSGRGLGHTGGTIDKLESVKGLKTDLSNDEFMHIAKECGVCVSGAGKNLVPADKKLYALRDVTATVRSIPLIVSSIMSKKLAGGSKSIVLDVKTGSGAFMRTLSDAQELAKSMVTIGKLSGRRVSAVVTNMDKPLGRSIGNSLEVMEAVSLLRDYKNSDPDLLEVCVTLASEMIALAKNISFEESKELVLTVLENGKAYQRFLKWISLQGGDISVFDKGSSYGSALYSTEILSPRDGYIASVDATGIGISAMMLGAGRASKDDSIDFSAGIVLLARVGDKVEKGQPVARLQSSTVANHSSASEKLLGSFAFSNEQPNKQALIYEIIR